MADPVSRVLKVVFLRRNIKVPYDYLYDGNKNPLGYPVVVPLNQQLTVGVVVDCGSPVESDSEGLRPVEKIATSVDPVPADLIKLGKWLANYYLTPLNQVFKAILPPRYLPRPQTAWEVQNGQTVSKKLPEELAGPFESEDVVSLKQLKQRTGWKQKKVISELEEPVSSGQLHRTVELKKPPTGRRLLNYVKLTEEEGQVESFVESAGRRQKELLGLLREEGDKFQKNLPEPLRRTDLLQRLEEENLIKREKRHKCRLPLTELETDKSAPSFSLTEEQRRVFAEISSTCREDEFAVHLVHGVTGSGKTEVYFQLVQSVLEENRTALVLVPEITLAVFLMQHFRRRFGEQLAVLHSGLSQGERRDEWHRIQQGEARVVLGVQSAVFAPLENLGLIVVDEEHDSSYKAGQAPRYHARDVAIKRAQLVDIPVVLGSATPSIESYSNTLQSRYRKHEMQSRPLGGQLPEVKIADLRNADSLLTQTLVEKTRQALAADHRAIWFLNRRGYSNFLLCTDCGETVGCNQCNVSLTYHSSPRRLRCHYCGYQRGIPGECPECGSDNLQLQGTGTQQLSKLAGELYPEAEIIRMDADTVSRKNKRFELLEKFKRTEGALLLGTQMVTKGLDFEKLDFVGVINVDTGLNFPDFRAGEKTFQQLVQVCGRAGRDKPGAMVLIQTYNPRHYAVQFGARRKYDDFFRQELSQRKPLSYPPFGRMIDFIASGPRKNSVVETLEKLEDSLPGTENIQLQGPVPCGLEKIKNKFRWHILLRGNFSSDWRRKTQQLLTEFKPSGKTRLFTDVDPL